MPRYLDIHTGMHGATPEALADAHARDLAVQARHDVHYLRVLVRPSDRSSVLLVRGAAERRRAGRASRGTWSAARRNLRGPGVRIGAEPRMCTRDMRMCTQRHGPPVIQWPASRRTG